MTDVILEDRHGEGDDDRIDIGFVKREDDEPRAGFVDHEPGFHRAGSAGGDDDLCHGGQRACVATGSWGMWTDIDDRSCAMESDRALTRHHCEGSTKLAAAGGCTDRPSGDPFEPRRSGFVVIGEGAKAKRLQHEHHIGAMGSDQMDPLGQVASGQDGAGYRCHDNEIRRVGCQGCTVTVRKRGVGDVKDISGLPDGNDRWLTGDQGWSNRMPNMMWTRETDRRLASLYATGQDVGSIALELGCNEKSVRTRVSTLGLLRRRTKGDTAVKGNAMWVVGPALASIMHVPSDDFCGDLIAQLDGQDA